MKRFLSFLVIGIGAFLLFGVTASAVTIGSVKVSENKDVRDNSTLMTVDIIVKGNVGTFSSWTAKVITEPGNSVVEVIGNDKWEGQKTADGVSFFYNDVNSTGVTTPEFTLGQVVVKLSEENVKANKCDVKFESTIGSTVVVPGNPNTGASFPIIAIFSGIALIGAAYYITRKNTKLYNV